MITVSISCGRTFVEKANVKSFRSAFAQIAHDRLNGEDFTQRFLLTLRHEFFKAQPWRR